MTVATESLVIEASIKDSLTGQVADLSASVKSFADVASKQFDATNKILARMAPAVQNAGAAAQAAQTKVSSFADVAQRKFAALGKAAVGIFAADVTARVFGFSGALDIVQKTADEVAKGINSIGRELLGLPSETAVAKIRAVNEELQKLEEQLYPDERVYAKGVGTFVFGTRQFTDPAQILHAKELVQTFREFVEETDDLRSIYAREKELREDLNKLALARTNDARKELDFANRLAERLKAREEHEREIARQIKSQVEDERRGMELRALRLSGPDAQTGYESVFFGRLNDLRARQESQERASVAEDLENFRLFQAKLEREGTFRGAGMSDRNQFIEDGDYFAFMADPIGALQQRRTDNLSLLARKRHEQVQLKYGGFTSERAGLEQVQTFSQGAQEAFDQLATHIQASLGSDAVQGTFDSFRGFFNDIITGAKSGGAALRGFGQSVIAMGADILAQSFAFQLLGVFGFRPTPGAGGFNIGIGTAANGAVFSGGIRSFASGGMAYGPQLAMIGDNPNRQEAVLPVERGADGVMGVRAMGGGGGSTINIRIDAVDGASVLRIMPQIEAALLQSAGTGQNWRLRQAWGMR